MTNQIKDLQGEREKLAEENEDLRVRLQYARGDLGKLQQKHISLQLELERCIEEKEDAVESLRQVQAASLKQSEVEAGQVKDDDTEGRVDAGATGQGNSEAEDFGNVTESAEIQVRCLSYSLPIAS